MDFPGTFIVTSGTYQKQHLFQSADDRFMLQEQLFIACQEFGFHLQAWAIFSNHYHLVGFTERNGVHDLTSALHGRTAQELNRRQNARGRRVWYRMLDTRLTFEKSYLARLNYVHTNPVKHGLVRLPEDYEWCSARWFKAHADRPFYETVRSFPTDAVNVYDDF